jgi:high affinity sulfate transporter 1
MQSSDPLRRIKTWLLYTIPGLQLLRHYPRTALRHDVAAGLSVAAVALPVGVAYAQLAGLSPVMGLYASILPLFAYALFGTSRQLIVGPDSATCALIAASVAPLALGNAELYLSLSLTLACLTGLICIAASFLKLGALADFLSKPILIGFLHGVALSIVLGQLGILFGFQVHAGGILPRLFEFCSKLHLTHWPTLAIGSATFLILQLTPKFLPRIPGALLAMALAGAMTALLHLEKLGVATVGLVPAGLPHLRLPQFPLEMLPHLLADAAGLALVSFASMMLTARSFAEKNGYEIDTDREFAALGMANIASALSQGFAISGADSRTATNDLNGGKTQLAGMVAALAIACVLMFLTTPLSYVPVAALAAVLVKGALSLINLKGLRQLYRMSRQEFALSLLATIGVVSVGAVDAILFVVILALLRFVRIVSRPSVELLGEVEGMPGLHPLNLHDNATTLPGLLLLRFNAPIVFFNAPYLRRALLSVVDQAEQPLRWIVLDMLPVTTVDATGYLTISDLSAKLRARGITLAVAGRMTEWRKRAEQKGFVADESGVRIKFYPTLRQAVRDYKQAHCAPSDPDVLVP